jgi:endonuclease YncB( thermonuclease family)
MHGDNMTTLRAVLILALAIATLTTPPAGAANYDGSGRVAWVTDGDTFRLESGERIRIAGIDAPETHRDQARCAGEVALGLRAKDRATRLLAGRDVTSVVSAAAIIGRSRPSSSTATISEPNWCKSGWR